MIKIAVILGMLLLLTAFAATFYALTLLATSLGAIGATYFTGGALTYYWVTFGFFSFLWFLMALGGVTEGLKKW